MRHLLLCCSLFVFFESQAQQVNPVPDYVFRNQMSVGRNAVTDTAAYISIGPRYGANKGLMPPIVSDTAAISGVKRNGLLIFSVQRNNFQYWDSINSKWNSVTANVDTTVIATRAWRQKGDDSLGALIALKVNISDTATMLTPYVRNAGVGLTKATQTLSADTVTMATRVRVQKAVDSLGSVKQNTLTNPVTGTGTTNRVAKFTASGTIGNGSIADSASAVSMTIRSNGNIGIGVSPSVWSSAFKALHIGGSGILASDGSVHNIGHNYFFDGTNPIYLNTGGANLYQQTAGQHSWFGAPSGTAGTTVTLTERMRLTAAGRLLVGTTTEGTNTVDIAGNLRTTTGANFATSSGNVGIGFATAPSAKLHVEQTAAAEGLRVDGATGAFVLVANGGATRTVNINAGLTIGGSYFTTPPTNGAIIQGNVGIGTTSPSEALHVVGRGRFTTIDSTSSPINVLTSDVNGVIRKTAPGVSGSGTANYVAKFTGTTAVGNSQIFDDGTNIGIGTASPSAKLSISGGSSFTNIGGLSGNTSFSGLSFTSSSSAILAANYNILGNGTDFILNRVTGGNIDFRENNSNQIRISSGGELLINTTTDVGDYRLQVNGNANFRDDVLIDTSLRVNRHIALDQTLSAWSLGNAVQGPQGATLFLAGGGVQSLANIYYDGAYKYTTSNPGAAMFLLQSGITFATYGSGTANGSLTGANEMVYAGGELRVGISDQGTFKLQVADKSYFGDEVQIASTTDLGNYKLQVTGDAILTGSITTGAPTSGTAAAWKLGTKVATSVQLDTGNYIEVEVGGTFYRLAIVTPL